MYYSPSEVHQHLMAETTPEFQYDGGDVEVWQQSLGAALRQQVGLDHFSDERCELNPRTLWTREHALGTIGKLVFASESCADVPAYICLPRDVAPPYRFMICVQGHNSGMHKAIGVDREDEAQEIANEGDRDFGLQCMRHGIAALCIEQRSFGERRELKQEMLFPGMCHDAAMHALMLRRTLIGERVYDVDRAIDYLALRGDAVMSSIGVMGNSGGGTTSLFSAALLPRISLAAPGSYFCRFKESIMSIRHCTCNYVPGLYSTADMSDIMGLFAPRPVVIVNGKEDDIFPIEATRDAFSALHRIYETCGAGGRCHLVVGDEGHRFYADAAWPLILKEFDRLGGRDTTC